MCDAACETLFFRFVADNLFGILKCSCTINPSATF